MVFPLSKLYYRLKTNSSFKSYTTQTRQSYTTQNALTATVVYGIWAKGTIAVKYFALDGSVSLETAVRNIFNLS